MTWRKRIVLAAAAAAALGGLGLALRPSPVRVDVAPVTRGSFEQTVDDEGKTRAKERYVVSAPLSGTLARIQLKAGDQVEEGTALATLVALDPALLDERSERELQARLGAAEAAKMRAAAALERARAAHDFAQLELERWRKLLADNVAARRDFEQAEFEAHATAHELEAAQFGERVAEHDVETARAALLRARSASGREQTPGEPWEIRSPVRGRVLRVLRESEGAVVVGTPLLEIADPAALEVVIDALTTDAVQIPAGAAVRIQRWGGANALDGRVRLIEPSAFTKVSALGIEEQRVNVIVDIVSPFQDWATLGDGFRVETSIVIFSGTDVIKAPASALFQDGEQWAVFVVANGTAYKRPVRLGRRSALEAAILQGLQPGEVVVLHATDAVRDGGRVAVRSSMR